MIGDFSNALALGWASGDNVPRQTVIHSAKKGQTALLRLPRWGNPWVGQFNNEGLLPSNIVAKDTF
jgi:hypothetical protein